MRLLLVLFIIGHSFNLIAQISWEQLEANNNEDVEIIHSDASLLVGQLLYPPTLLVSEDFGISWEEITTIPEQRRVPLVRQKSDGDYLILLDNEIVSWTPGSNTFMDVLDLGVGLWTTVAPLSNGNFMVAGISEPLSLYDANGTLLKSLSTERIQEIITTDQDEHYIFQGNPFGNMVTINSDLEIIKQGVDGLYVSDHFKYDGSRFYNSRFYSDDGDNWFPYGNDLYGVVTFLNNGDIHLIADCAYSNTSDFCDEVYLSSDRGETFQFQGDLGLNFTLPSAGSINFRSDTYLGTQAVGPSGLLVFDAGNNYYSDDGITDWILRGQEVGQSFAFEVEAASKEGVFIRDDEFKYKGSDAADWLTTTSIDSCANFRRLVSLPNGDFMTYESCKSTDGGATWFGPNLGTWSVFVKDSVVYTAGNSQVYISYDNGNEWAVNNLPLQQFDWGFFIETAVYDFSTTGYFYANQYIPDVGPAKYNLQGDLISPVSFDDEVLFDLRTSYEGSKVYTLTVDPSNGNDKFYVSFDDAITFEERSLPLTFSTARLYLDVDHEGSLYLRNDIQIWKSMDDGDTWIDISPELMSAVTIRDFDVSWDGHAFVATTGMGVLRTVLPVCEAVGEGSTSISEMEFGAFNFYPNPAHDILNIQIEGIEDYFSFQILDVLGKEMLQQSINKGQSDYVVNVSGFESGSYLLALRNSVGIVELNKFIIAR